MQVADAFFATASDAILAQYLEKEQKSWVGSMIGVVLWSDPQECKAVIWCEDHGDLAFYNASDPDPCQGPDLDAGDLVEFEVEVSRNLRFAHNPRLLQEGAGAPLRDALNSQPGRVKRPSGPSVCRRNSADVIQLHSPVKRPHKYHAAKRTG